MKQIACSYSLACLLILLVIMSSLELFPQTNRTEDKSSMLSLSEDHHRLYTDPASQCNLASLAWSPANITLGDLFCEKTPLRLMFTSPDVLSSSNGRD